MDALADFSDFERALLGSALLRGSSGLNAPSTIRACSEWIL